MQDEDELIEAIEVLLKITGQLNKSEINPAIQKSKADKIKSIMTDIESYKSISNKGASGDAGKKEELFFKITEYLDELDLE